MEKSNIIAKIYGYLVCLVAVITFLISITNLVNSFIDKGDPLHAERYSFDKGPNLASFDTYKLDVLKDVKTETDTSRVSLVPDDKTLQAMYDAAKSDKMQSSLHNINRNITVDLMLIVICIVLFAIHWIWMRRLSRASA